MLILAIDSATHACSAAVVEDGRPRARGLVISGRGQAEILMPMVVEAMAEAGRAFSDLDLVAVTRGPGGFTGIRIGMAAARGIALAAGCPCVGVDTLDAVAEGVPPGEREGRNLLVVLDAKRADVYARVYGPGLEPLGPPTAVLPAALPGLLPSSLPTVVVGDAAETALAALRAGGREAIASAAPGHPDAEIVAVLARRSWVPGETREPPRPLYLRPPDATPAPNGGRLRP